LTGRVLFIISFFAAIVLFLSCNKDKESDPIIDIDGNVYKTVVIGEQVWMAENLRVTRFNDGTAIKLTENNEEWKNITEAAFSWYDNDSSLYGNQYGALYNGYAAQNKRLCPIGWHVPSVNNFLKLIETLGDTLTAGGKLKSDDDSQWNTPNTGADNSSHFSALPAGMRYFEGTFSSASYFTGYWSSIEVNADTSTFISLSYLDSKVIFIEGSKNLGFSIRCVKNAE
jgi:uncharacterized protein (TIGR02145 family)